MTAMYIHSIIREHDDYFMITRPGYQRHPLNRTSAKNMVEDAQKAKTCFTPSPIPLGWEVMFKPTFQEQWTQEVDETHDDFLAGTGRW